MALQNQSDFYLHYKMITIMGQNLLVNKVVFLYFSKVNKYKKGCYFNPMQRLRK